MISNRQIAAFVAIMVAASVLTVIVAYYVLYAFVLHDPRDPLAKAGGLSPVQEEALRPTTK
jgi:hypothetical protein